MIKGLGIVFGICLILGLPIGVSLGLAAIFPKLINPSFMADAQYIIRGMLGGLDSTPMLAIPMFMLSGAIMAQGGISEKLFNVFAFFLGKCTAGMPCAAIVTCLFFGAISGSGAATCAAVGGMAIPVMIKLGYHKDFAAAICATAGGLGVIIPPSIPFILYSTAAGASVSDMFIGGIVPGILIAICLMVWAYIKCKFMGEDTEKIAAADIIEAVQMGNIDMSMSGVANYAPFVDKFSVFDLGCIPWSYASVNKALQSPKIHNMLGDAAKEMDFRVMGIFLDGFRVVFACHKPVTSFADFKNLKIRCQPNPNMIALWQNLTTAPTPLASGEVYISMQQGLIDAIEQNAATMVSDKTCEQGKFITETNHIANIHVIMFNNEKFNALPKSYQEMLDGVMDSYRDYIATRAEKDNREATEYMVSTGVKVVDFPASELKKMQDAALPQHALVEKMAGAEIVAIWKDALAEAYAE